MRGEADIEPLDELVALGLIQQLKRKKKNFRIRTDKTREAPLKIQCVTYGESDVWTQKMLQQHDALARLLRT